MISVGFVIIGRNEGARLHRCLLSICPEHPVVYVDSGSTDGSVAAARKLGAAIVELDMSRPFTAARARNAGAAVLPPQCTIIQFIDGDCELQSEWLDIALPLFSNNTKLAAVFGRRREMQPKVSIYNWLCDLEWSVSVGPARYFGGDVLIRRSAMVDAGCYAEEMIAGEEPDLAIRLRQRGYQLLCIAAEMTLHDACIFTFKQWWRRSIRSGHAYAELAVRHGSPFSDYRRRLFGVLLWAGVVPLLVFGLLIVATIFRDPALRFFGFGLLSLPLVQFGRLALREMPRHGARLGLFVAAFLMIAKPAQAIGASRYWVARILDRRSEIIEYKEQNL